MRQQLCSEKMRGFVRFFFWLWLQWFRVNTMAGSLGKTGLLGRRASLGQIGHLWGFRRGLMLQYMTRTDIAS